jgi:tRNA G10  N-methylase Trm11
MTYLAILGRQPALGIAELEKVFGNKSIHPVSDQAVQIDSKSFEIQRLGGVLKAGKIIAELPLKDWHQVSQKIVQYYTNQWSSFESKITLGISAYGFFIDAREVQKTGIILKQKLKKYNTSLRLVPNPEPALSTAISHNNKLGLSPNKVELIIVRTNNSNFIIAESTGSQNITAYAKRDQERPKRDAFVGMLPPKLAQIMINLATGNSGVYSSRATDVTFRSDPLQPKSDQTPGPLSDQERSRITEESASKGEQKRLTILDPFCGTGVILQEALLMGYSAYGTDLSEKMISYSQTNLDWLSENSRNRFDYKLNEGDAMKMKWQQPIDTVVCETYLGQPFSAPPSPAKLEEVKDNCNHIITEFLKNLAPQIKSNTNICVAVPAWRNKDNQFVHLPLIATIARLGYKPHEFVNISQNDLLYYRENQIVARELLVLTKV